MILIVLDCIKFKLFVMLLCHMRSSFSMPLLYHAYVYLEFLILACTIYILAPVCPIFFVNVLPSVFVFIIFSIIIFPFFWSPSRESFHWSLSEHYSLNQAQNGHFQFHRLPIYSLFIFACKKPCDHSTFLT